MTSLCQQIPLAQRFVLTQILDDKFVSADTAGATVCADTNNGGTRA
jgi:hypothetical protein